MITGIDLRTTNSVVAASVITNEEGRRITPSIAFTDPGEPLVGAIAKRQPVTNPARRVCTRSKCFMGLRLNEVRELIARVPYKVVAGKADGVAVREGCFQGSRPYLPSF
jgi:molecular chaperone DnaK